MASASITFHDVAWRWPDGDPLLQGLDLQVPAGTTGLVGANGAGKTTLLRLVAGDLSPVTGSVQVVGTVGWLRQDLTLHAETPVDERLGIASVRAAIRAVESGDPDPRHFDTIGDAWDIDERATAELARVGLPHDVLDRRIGELSGGEATQLSLAALLLARPDILLLDEPTNNLDRVARHRVHDLVAGFRGTLVVVSHDRELLELVDRIAELRSGPSGTRGVSWYGGGWSAYREQAEAEQALAEQAVVAAKADVRRQHQQLMDAQTAIARRANQGRKVQESGSLPKILAGARKRSAEESAGRLRGVHEQRLDDARGRLEEARDGVAADREISIDLPETAVHRGQHVLTLEAVETRVAGPFDLAVVGPERVAVTGANGSGKTTLLRTIVGELEPVAGSVRVTVPVRFLPQRLDLLDPGLSVLENARLQAPGTELQEIRSRLARFLFRGRAADRRVGVLSGGELLRATLACVLLAAPPPRLLVLDEPTNNLDLASLRQLVEALTAYRGALIVVSHDETFLAELGITRRIDLGKR
ncbi:ABC-F family ATP-binding cassette domain-containing protein [Nocardioides daejeonensis]|uniref:ABC-F family ATP-binding cassette domain-containing protein n=1 Tax=Nocardioides daejeonensis TaxID=1046556 RepID=UPI000D7474ED|nr:ABC-F family ATP-binding cassette domain-containing protein [Nocardioides daejeonensis]